MTIKCRMCSQEKDESDFYSAGKKWFRRVCKPCFREDRKKYVKTPEQLEKKREYERRFHGANPTYAHDYVLMKSYGISHEDYEKMLADQGGCCKICGADDPAKSNKKAKFFSVDHCHTTGQVRGLLCLHCNTFIGYARDNTELLTKAIEYLKN